MNDIDPKVALSQYATAGCLNNVFRNKIDAEIIVGLCDKVSPEFIAKIALLRPDESIGFCAYLAARGKNDLLRKVFNRVIADGVTLRGFVWLLRSGVFGNRRITNTSKQLITRWFNSRTVTEIFSKSAGDNPSLADIIILTHPKPLTAEKSALYQWFLDGKCDTDNLPDIVKQFCDFKNGLTKEVLGVHIDTLASLATPLSDNQWRQIVVSPNWRWTIENITKLNECTHVLRDKAIAKIAYENLQRDNKLPYEIMSYYLTAGLISDDMERNLVYALVISC